MPKGEVAAITMSDEFIHSKQSQASRAWNAKGKNSRKEKVIPLTNI